jgi:hypothetical protein
MREPSKARIRLMTNISLPTLKRLCMLSNNECAFPGCNMPLSESTGTITGEVCHIKAANKEGPRYDPAQTEQSRHAVANLILLCPRHHKIVDTETETYTSAMLQAFKMAHEDKSTLEISPAMSKFAEALYQTKNITIKSEGGQLAVNSPGAVQINNLNIKTQKTKVTVSPIQGSIGNNARARGYIKYLIDRYNEYQQADKSKAGSYKFIAIYKAIEREFGTKWDLIDESQFSSLVIFLQGRIDKTILGRNLKAKLKPRYHDFPDHP